MWYVVEKESGEIGTVPLDTKEHAIKICGMCNRGHNLAFDPDDPNARPYSKIYYYVMEYDEYLE